jgi:hypothetical protein
MSKRIGRKIGFLTRLLDFYKNSYFYLSLIIINELQSLGYNLISLGEILKLLRMRLGGILSSVLTRQEILIDE